MSSRTDSKTVSQFASLTLRLKKKLQSPQTRQFERIKQPSSQRSKPADLNLQPQSLGLLSEQQQAVVTSLQYFKALVDRLGVDRPGENKLALDQSMVGGLLGGASGGVLEAVQILVQLEPHLRNRKSISACLTRLYRSLAHLINWVDQVILQGVSHDNKESTESVTTVIRGVLNNVKELVRLAGERRECSAPSSPVQSQSGLFGDQKTTEKTSPCRSAAENDGGLKMETTGEEEVDLAPPKPVMPLLHVTPPPGLNPPALPPKRRSSSLVPAPVPFLAPCKVAIVAPMRHEPEADTQLEQELEDDCLKRFSSSSADSVYTMNSEDDPDYEFLLKDLSSSEALPPLPSTVPPALPPALPEKTRRSSAGVLHSNSPSSFDFESPPLDDPSYDEPESECLSPTKTPPPLPEKKRHIHQYLQICSSYSDQSPVEFYQRPPLLSQRNISRHRELDAVDPLSSSHPDVQSLPSPELPPAPALPPKKKQQDSNDKHTEEGQNDESFQSIHPETDLWQRSEEQQQEELFLTNQQEIQQRITLKSEEEDGPDVKAATPEILLVHATAPPSNEQDLYREAFLCTYRSFISPNEIISKLQRRYRHLCEQQEPADLTATKHTFQLLVRVVDDLSAVDLEDDLLLLLMELVFSLLIGGELGPALLLHSNILSKMEKRWQLIGSPHSLCPLAARGVAARPGTLLDFRSQDLAEQLTLLDSRLFHKIELPELLLWSKEQNEEKSPNLTEFTQHFNNVSFWVRSVVILQDKPQDREKLLLKFLKIMKHLKKLNNFNSYLSILSALDSAPLRRLDWQRSTSETLEEYSSLIDSSSSFRAYRAALAEVDPPCIPYLGLILQDLTFVHLGNPETLLTSQGSAVNFSKRWQQFNILDTLRSYQQVGYSLQPDDDIISFFNDFNDHLAEEALWELSLRIRPRNTPRSAQR
ncbi:rap guanine nucleotide exchange factor 1-like [Cololabis saira]|uniref:rap guanine nucleotide exchange factor 1-like n=1 Tax=Cololabis saira TaxID=129043 RepID=UPI002AD5584B|nr:rap guanine nucleotide exchange factor 1-like [Cololabis saira]